MADLIKRSIITISIILLCASLVAPNFVEQEVEIIFREHMRTEAGIKQMIPPEMISDFIQDRENGLGLYFNEAECVPTATEKIQADHRCVLHAKYVTAALLNEMAQANPNLIDDLRTGLMPNGIERFYSFLEEGDFKDLHIRLGLDLQGGMRATFRADFDIYLTKLEEKLRPIIEQQQAILDNTESTEDDKENARIELEDYDRQLSLTEVRKEELLFQAKQIIDKRLAAQNMTEPEVRVQPDSYSIGVDMPGVANSSEVLNKIKDTVTVEYRIVMDSPTDRLNREFQNELRQITKLYREGLVDERDVKDILLDVRTRAEAAGIEMLQKNGEGDMEKGRIFLYWRRGGRGAGTALLPREFRVLGPIRMDGNDMTDAQGSPHPTSGWYQIDFVLSGAGAEKFGDLTTANVNRRLAILWGDRVVSDPRIQGPIPGGRGIITGQFSQTESAEVSNIIREGALPLPLEVLSVSFVGPSLGQESIRAGIVSIVVGFLLVIFFMIGYYRLTGLIAVVALFLNLLIMGAILSLLEFTLTLPGFAGIILTVGMAVDANVIIFEKIKEDLRVGKAPSLAIESGFNASFWTILDANVTTLIATIILYYRGDGPIKGFSITLFWGLISSMFTALFVSRLIFNWVEHTFHPKQLSIGWGFKKQSS